MPTSDSADHTLFLPFTPELVNVHQRGQFNFAMEDVFVYPVERFPQSTTDLFSRGDAKHSIQLFQGKLLGFREDKKSYQS